MSRKFNGIGNDKEFFAASQFTRVMPTLKDKIRVVYPPCDVDAITAGVMKPVSRKVRREKNEWNFSVFGPAFDSSEYEGERLGQKSKKCRMDLGTGFSTECRC